MSINDDKTGSQKPLIRKEWKRKDRFATQVEVDLLKKGIELKIITALIDGIILSIEYGLIFALYNDNSAITFNPDNLQSVQGDDKLKFADRKQFVKAIKLVLQDHHKIYIHQENDEPPRKIILLND